MTLFELFFGLSAVILGLALTHIVATVQKLLHAGRRVAWAPEPVLVTAIIFIVIIFVWITQWNERSTQSITTAQAILEVLKMLAIYFVAAAALPLPNEGDERVDLFTHYDRTRRLTFGALTTGLLLFLTYNIIERGYVVHSVIDLLGLLFIPFVYLSLIFIRWRPYNVLALVFIFCLFTYSVWSVKLTS